MTGMWRIPLVDLVRNNNTDTVIVNCSPLEFLLACSPPADAIHNVYELKTQPELVQYYHATAGFPTKPTWLKAIKNIQFASWPGLTADAVNRHYPDSEETPKGHGRKALSGLHSTKVTTPALDNSAEVFGVEDSTRPTKKKKTVFHWILDMEDKATLKIYTNQPGQFPRKSSRGNQYIMVLAEVDSDAILVEPMKNRTAGKMVPAYQVLIDHLNSAGLFPKLHILDNECSADMKETIKSNKMVFQLVPPMIIVATWPRRQFKPSKNTLWPSCVAPTNHSCCTCGIISYHKLNIHSTCYDHLECRPQYSHVHTYGNSMTTMPTHSRRLDARSRHILSQPFESHGLPTRPAGSTWVMRGIIIGATRSISPTLATRESATQSSSNTST